MDIREYQHKAHKTSAVKGDRILHAVFGLASESGEIAAAFQKYHRGDYDFEECRRRVRKELGDVLWYAAEVATVMNYDLDSVAADNLEKLADRQRRNLIQGGGDER